MRADWTEEVIEAGLAEIFIRDRGDLTEEALEAALTDIFNFTTDRGEVLSVRPTRMHVPRYPGESWLRWRIRVAAARRLMQDKSKPSRGPYMRAALAHVRQQNAIALRRRRTVLVPNSKPLPAVDKPKAIRYLFSGRW